ncbi:MAG: TonB-dependent receptor, partial [Bacteroidetes bacterium]|nr:TonB-dependent receptor [Bacteroidota bacterium]
TVSKSDNLTTRVLENKTTRIHYNINTSFNSKINSKLFVKVGAIAEIMNLDLFYRNRRFTSGWNEIWNFNDYTQLYQGYTHAKYNLNEKLTFNVGLHAQLLALNNSSSIEPRAGIKYQMNQKNSLSIGYGLHSQMQPTDVYFYRALNPDGSYDQSNKDLGFTKSHHFVIGYDVLPVKDWRIKSEIYYQMLFDVPVSERPGSFSMLNTGASFAPNEQGYLKNTGTGTNYGAELTIEKFFSKGYYGLITGTIYESKYKGSDNIERNTAFNGKFVYNILIGKEFKLGKDKRNSLTVDVKMTQAGGRYYTPVDLAASQMVKQQVLMGDDYAFTSRNPDFFRLDVKTGYTFNSTKRKLSHSIFFDVQNVTNNKNVFAQRYNPITNTINTAYQIGLFPNFVYKVQF